MRLPRLKVHEIDFLKLKGYFPFYCYGFVKFSLCLQKEIIFVRKET